MLCHIDAPSVLSELYLIQGAIQYYRYLTLQKDSCLMNI